MPNTSSFLNAIYEDLQEVLLGEDIVSCKGIVILKVGALLVWVQWVQLQSHIWEKLILHPLILRKSDFVPLIFCTKMPFIFSLLSKYENLHPQF